MIIQSLLILSYTYMCFGISYDVIWAQNYCGEQDRYPTSYEQPHSSPCAFCTNDVVTLRINSTSTIYENLYRVPTETAMMNCDATANSNTINYAFSDKLEINIRSGGSDSALSFVVRAEPYYFISTSNGTQSSAETNLTQSPNTCLQMAFTVTFDEGSDCGNYKADCTFNSVFIDPASSLMCMNVTIPADTTTTPMTTPATTPSNDLSIVITIQEPPNLAAIIVLAILIVLIIVAIILLLVIGISLLVYYGSGKEFPYTKKIPNQYEMTN